MSLEWINPAALAGLAAVAGPVLVHLLRRQRAPRVAFPTLRFLVSTRAAAARFTTPSDRLLLILRIGIVAAAAIASAQPVLVTAWRRAAWQERTARALVIDASDSVASAARQVREAVSAEYRGSTDITEIHAADLADGLKQAVAALRDVRAGRVEIVVISDFQKGALTAADLGALPAEAGVRFVAIDAGRPAGVFPGLRVIEPDANAAVEQAITLERTRTRVAMTAVSAAPRGPAILSPPGQDAAVRSLRRIVAAAGAPELPANRGLTLIFPGVQPPPVGPLRAGWMADAFRAAASDERLRREASTSVIDARSALPASWRPLVRSRSGQPVVSLAAIEDDLAAYVSASPAELVSAAALRALLLAIATPPGWPEREVERIPGARLAEWTRDPRPRSSGGKHEAPGDARWFWGVAMALLLVETAARKSSVESRQDNARAA